LVQLDEKTLLIFGGLNKRTRYNDVWVCNVEEKTWQEVDVTPDEEGGGHPEPRAHFSATRFGNRILIFGGYGGSGQVYADMWVLHTADGAYRWENLTPKIQGTGASHESAEASHMKG
jgi:hypothetical protein